MSRRRQDITTLRRSTGSAHGLQRNRAGHPAHRTALCAHGRATNTIADLSRCSVVPVSVQGGVPPCTGTTKLSRGSLQQRGHARHAALCTALSRSGAAYQAPPLFLCWRVVVSASGESGLPLSPGTTKLSRGYGEQRGQAARADFVWSVLRTVGLPGQPHRLRYAAASGLSQWRKRSTAIARHHYVSARSRIATSGQLARPGRG